MFLVISVYFTLRNILPKSGTFLPGHPVFMWLTRLRVSNGRRRFISTIPVVVKHSDSLKVCVLISTLKNISMRYCLVCRQYKFSMRQHGCSRREKDAVFVILLEIFVNKRPFLQVVIAE